jgi:hypothetical protein
MWFAAIQEIKHKQDLADLAPKGCFIPAQPVERVVADWLAVNVFERRKLDLERMFDPLRIDDGCAPPRPFGGRCAWPDYQRGKIMKLRNSGSISAPR